jgi:hypothetical protein
LNIENEIEEGSLFEKEQRVFKDFLLYEEEQQRILPIEHFCLQDALANYEFELLKKSIESSAFFYYKFVVNFDAMVQIMKNLEHLIKWDFKGLFITPLAFSSLLGDLSTYSVFLHYLFFFLFFRDFYYYEENVRYADFVLNEPKLKFDYLESIKESFGFLLQGSAGFSSFFNILEIFFDSKAKNFRDFFFRIVMEKNRFENSLFAIIEKDKDSFNKLFFRKSFNEIKAVDDIFYTAFIMGGGNEVQRFKTFFFDLIRKSVYSKNFFKTLEDGKAKFESLFFEIDQDLFQKIILKLNKEKREFNKNSFLNL